MSVLVNLGLTVSGAVTLFALFSVQFTVSITLPAELNCWVIVVMSALYAVLAIGQLVHRRRRTVRIVRDGLVTPFEELEMAGAEQR